MKLTLSTAVIAAAVLSGTAYAADLPSKKAAFFPPPPPPPPIWTGFYAGLNAGYSWSENKILTNSGAFAFSDTSGLNNAGAFAVGNALAASSGFALSAQRDGFIGGGQIGYNFQIAESFVVGIEADAQGLAASGGSVGASKVTSLAPWGFPAESYASTFNASKSIDYLGTVRGRVGYLVTPTLLVYGTGGLAYGGVNLRSSFFAQESLGPGVYPPIFGAGSFSDTRVGWTAGGGVEWLFLPGWSAKIEYLHYDLGTVTTPTSFLVQTSGGLLWGGAVSTTSARFNGHIVRVGLNYHFDLFNPATPVIAKY